MTWKTAGHVQHTDKNGDTYDRRVAYNPETGQVDRTFGTEQGYSDSVKTSRSVESASSESEALANAKADLKSTF